ncbi:uracil-DNA glycosylase [Candidatus Saccharibacteria bacterium]|nr:uracil-DNA glycosylase [Candidatus Saccharibacteria bacterium]
MSKQQNLDLIKADIINSNVCSQLAQNATNLVFGVGDPNADIVFIGEAPGKKEDEQGEPFVGASGQFLNDMLQSIHLNRNQIYITNIVKYRPPHNRDPLPSEKEEFLPYLERQLNVIKPKLIVTLGRHSTSVFLPELQISQVHGQPKRKDGRVFLPMYHPAAALYNGGLRKTLENDFKNINKTLTLIRKGK